jgi:signal transduction histidine kinase
VRRRILLAIVAVTLAAVATFFVPAALAVRSSTRRKDSLDLERDAAIVASQISPTGPIDVSRLQALVGPDRKLGFYDSVTRSIRGTGPEIPDEPVLLALEGQFAEGWSGGDLVAAVPVRGGPGGPSLVVRIEEPGSVSRGRIERTLLVLAAIGAAIVAGAVAVGVLLTRRLTRPIEELTTWAGAHDDSPPPAATGIGELDELRATLVDGRARVDDALQRERAFSSHVSHQLRTPVAALRTAIETELTAPRPDPTSLLNEGLGAVDRLEATITSLLALARHTDRRAELCDATALVSDQVERWRPTLAAGGRDIRVAGPPVPATVDAVTVRHILDVLIENALSHGAGRIDVTVGSGIADGDRRELVIAVADDGALAPDVDPFTERAADTGRGIGLRLARTLAEAWGGRLVLRTASPTTFSLSLPLQAANDYPALTSR